MFCFRTLDNFSMNNKKNYQSKLYRVFSHPIKAPGTVIFLFNIVFMIRLNTSYSGPDISLLNLLSYFFSRSSLKSNQTHRNQFQSSTCNKTLSYCYHTCNKTLPECCHTCNKTLPDCCHTSWGAVVSTPV